MPAAEMMGQVSGGKLNSVREDLHCWLDSGADCGVKLIKSNGLLTEKSLNVLLEVLEGRGNPAATIYRSVGVSLRSTRSRAIPSVRSGWMHVVRDARGKNL